MFDQGVMSLHRISNRRLCLLLGIFIFGYSWLAGACLQLWVIPKLFSNAGASDGLVVLDSIGFDRIAKVRAIEIVNQGWSAWELRPQGQSPAGIATLFYVLFGSSPLSMLPFNATVHALSACMVMVIFRNYFSAVPAMIGALFFSLNPASLEWVAQIHRDGIFILGNLLLIHGLMSFSRQYEANADQRPWHLLSLVAIPIVGSLLIWVARPYWLQVMLATFLVSSVVFIFVGLSRRGRISKRRMACLTAMLVSVAAFQFSLIRFFSPFDPVVMPDVTNMASDLGSGKGSGKRSGGGLPSGPVSGSDFEPVLEPLTPHSFVWRQSEWLPMFIERRFYGIVLFRLGVIKTGGNTLADPDQLLDSAGAIIEYVPRALQLGILSPLPNLWGGQASTPAMTMARKVMGAVTVLFYACLVGTAMGLYRMRKLLALWVMIGTCCFAILIYAITYPNIGSLVRFRYGFYMLLVGFGVASWCNLLWFRKKLN